MTVTLTQTRVRPDDTRYDIVMIGANFSNSRVIVRVRFGSGDEQDIIYGGQRLTDLLNAVPQFKGLKSAVESYIASTEPGLGGT